MQSQFVKLPFTHPMSQKSSETVTQACVANTTAKKLHIVLVTETWLPDINGVANSLFQLMRQLKQMGHRISLVRPRQAEAIEQQMGQNFAKTDAHKQAPGFDFSLAIDHQITVKGMAMPYYANLRMGMPNKKELLTQFKSLNADIVHIATEGPLGWVAWQVARTLGIKVSTGYHTAFHDFSRHFFGKNKDKLMLFCLITPIISSVIMSYLRYLHNCCDATCVPSEKTLNELNKLGFKRLTIVGRGVDRLLFNPQRRCSELRKSWGAGEQTTVLMYVGRVSPEKGIDTVIKAFRALQLAQLHRELKLVIVGDGPDKEGLMQEYTSQSIHLAEQDIIFAGFQTGVALAEHYASSDAFVFASQVETFGNVVTEAMASGVPVFAYHDAAAAMLVDSDCGKTVKVGDQTAFVNMIANLPKQHQLHAMRKMAEQKVSKFGWQAPAEAMLAMFYQILGGDDAVQKAEPIKTTSDNIYGYTN